MPNIAPGLWAVAAACVEPRIDLAPAAITAGAALFQSLGVPLMFPDENGFANSLLDPTSNVFLGNLAPTLLVADDGSEGAGRSALHDSWHRAARPSPPTHLR